MDNFSPMLLFSFIVSGFALLFTAIYLSQNQVNQIELTILFGVFGFALWIHVLTGLKLKLMKEEFND